MCFKLHQVYQLLNEQQRRTDIQNIVQCTWVSMVRTRLRRQSPL